MIFYILAIISIACFITAAYLHLTEKGQIKASVKNDKGWSGNTRKTMTRAQAKIAGIDNIWQPNKWTLSGKVSGHDSGDVRKANKDGLIAGILISVLLIIVYILLI